MTFKNSLVRSIAAVESKTFGFRQFNKKKKKIWIWETVHTRIVSQVFECWCLFMNATNRDAFENQSPRRTWMDVKISWILLLLLLTNNVISWKCYKWLGPWFGTTSQLPLGKHKLYLLFVKSLRLTFFQEFLSSALWSSWNSAL